jgi:hypothetical protein
MEEGEEKERKKKRKRKIARGKEDFPGAGPALLTLQQVTAFRCN